MDVAAAGADETVGLAVGPVEIEKRGPRRVQQGSAASEEVVAAGGAVKRLAANLHPLRLICFPQAHSHILSNSGDSLQATDKLTVGKALFAPASETSVRVASCRQYPSPSLELKCPRQDDPSEDRFRRR